MPLESQLRTRIVKALRERGGFWVVVHQSGTQTIGLPDIIGFLEPNFYGLEVKRPGRENTLTERQSRILQSIRNVGGRSGVVTSIDDALRFLDDPKFAGVVAHRRKK